VKFNAKLVLVELAVALLIAAAYGTLAEAKCAPNGWALQFVSAVASSSGGDDTGGGRLGGAGGSFYTFEDPDYPEGTRIAGEVVIFADPDSQNTSGVLLRLELADD